MKRSINTTQKLYAIRPFDPKLLESQMKAFAQHLLVNKGLKKTTLHNMVKLVRNPLIKYRTLYPTHQMVMEHIAGLHEKKYSFFHITNSSLALERYTEFIGQPVKLGRPRKPKQLPKDTLSEAEIAVIIAAAKNIREKAILTLLAYSGIRNEELCNLRKKDLDLGNNMVFVEQGKGSKDRSVPITGACVKILMEYLAAFPRGEQDYLFTTLRHGQRYSEWALRRLVKRIVKRTFVKKKVHPHLFRHSLATNMLMRGANIFTIQKLLGHSHIQTTMIYLNPRTTRLLAEYQAFAPSYT